MLFENIARNAERRGLGGKRKALVEQINKSGRFVFDAAASQAVAQMAHLKPARMLVAKEFLRLPFESVWIESLDKERVHVLRQMGYRIVEDDSREKPYRTGHLLWKSRHKPDRIYFWNAWSRTQGVAEIDDFSFSSFCLQIDLDFESADPDFLRLCQKRVREYWSRSGKAGRTGGFSEEDLDALARIKANSQPMICPFLKNMKSVKQMQRNRKDPEIQSALRALALDAGKETPFVLAELLLLNCKNGVTREPVQDEPDVPRRPERPDLLTSPIAPPTPAPERRRKYTLVRMRVPKGALGTGSTTYKARAAHWVMGHPKVRKTGVFWWSPHVRGIGPQPESPTTRLVKG